MQCWPIPIFGGQLYLSELVGGNFWPDIIMSKFHDHFSNRPAQLLGSPKFWGRHPWRKRGGIFMPRPLADPSTRAFVAGDFNMWGWIPWLGRISWPQLPISLRWFMSCRIRQRFVLTMPSFQETPPYQMSDLRDAARIRRYDRGMSQVLQCSLHFG